MSERIGGSYDDALYKLTFTLLYILFKFLLYALIVLPSEFMYIVVVFISLCLQHGLFTVVHKHYSPEAWKQFAIENKDHLKVISVWYFSAMEMVLI